MTHKVDLWMGFVFILGVGYICAVQAYDPKVCVRVESVPYTRSEYKGRQVPYQKHSFWRGWETKYRMEYGWQDVVDYRSETKQYCCDGYEGSIINCKPVCAGGCSGNSYCTAPNICSCKDGYGGADCHPICSNCGRNEYCLSPNRCVCNEGYQKIHGEGECLPVCPDPCGNSSFCAEPGVCECIVGYAKSASNDSCRPVCSPECGSNSFCQQPNVCACEKGYQADGEGNCVPICNAGCGDHSQCVRPGVCECEAGYAEGEVGNCLPVCSQGCPEHSSCLTPSVCICDPGYTMKADRCEPHCPQQCSDYAQCTAPNVCECYPGYVATGEDGKCEPKCSQGCANGFCFFPEVCVCSIGYLMGPNQTCEPQCSLNCVHGECTQPETCSCMPGYRFQGSSQHICEAVCEKGCEHGDCVAPEICLCHVGYQPVENVCQPVCETSCVNSTCTGPDQCSCLEGYEHSSNSTCIPHCSKGCEHGDCLEPEVCTCRPGYEQTEEGCTLRITSTTASFSTPSDDSTNPAVVPFAGLLQLPVANCSEDCPCWNEFDELGPLTNAKCVQLCQDSHDKPCLDLRECSCDLSSGQLVCEGSGDYSSEQARYICKKPKLGKIEAAKDTSKSLGWLHVVGWCIAVVGLVAIVVAIALKLYPKYASKRAYQVDEAICEDSL
ncbi:multiple epidermal growth factor-like domains protein 10 [Drosophila guanche]|uniref:Blast:Tenascin-X n=1 Tax=Drosophila guanche TaxID=7266 RepID=A0A3B0JJU9_DROGU|nr:multiple epidermal growth factor-like domains protein 10 [Drosophila guanche]SPP82505.1 blast:Tenascin-X [Drosophila guanche]